MWVNFKVFGVLPLMFPVGKTAATLGLTGNEVFESVFGSPNTTSPEAGGYSHRFQRVQQATWSSIRMAHPS